MIAPGRLASILAVAEPAGVLEPYGEVGCLGPGYDGGRCEAGQRLEVDVPDPGRVRLLTRALAQPE